MVRGSIRSLAACLQENLCPQGTSLDFPWPLLVVGTLHRRASHQLFRIVLHRAVSQYPNKPMRDHKSCLEKPFSYSRFRPIRYSHLRSYRLIRPTPD